MSVPVAATRVDERLTVEGLVALFDARTGSTVGVEEELMLLDRETLELSPAAPQILDEVRDDERYAAELREAQIEIRTPVCGNSVAAGLCLADAILELRDRLGAKVVVASAGTHPFSSDWGRLTEGERYREIADEFPEAERRDLPAGLHVHVGIGGADRALAVFNAARSYLPELTALAANSPFVAGRDTGMATCRAELAFARHRTGVPPAFPTWAAYVELVEWGRRGGMLRDAAQLWWDLRPHPVFGTIELRATDAQTRLEDAVAVAGVFQCLVVWLSARFDAGDELPVHDASRIGENLWRARRYGTHATVAELATGDPVELRARISRLLDVLEPTAERHGMTWSLLTARALLAGNGADRQRYVAEERGLPGLTRWLALETTASAQEYLERRS